VFNLIKLHDNSDARQLWIRVKLSDTTKIKLKKDVILNDFDIPSSTFDEWMRKERVPIVFTNNKPSTIERYNQCFEELFMIKTRNYTRRKQSDYFVSEIKSKIIYRFFTRILGFPEGKKSKIIRFPSIVNQFNKDEKRALIQGLLLTDGGKSNNSFHYCTASNGLCEDVVKILSEFDVLSTVSKQIFKNGTEYYHIIMSLEDANSLLSMPK